MKVCLWVAAAAGGSLEGVTVAAWGLTSMNRKSAGLVYLRTQGPPPVQMVKLLIGLKGAHG